jgi:SAM-dependent methyltransferase
VRGFPDDPRNPDAWNRFWQAILDRRLTWLGEITPAAQPLQIQYGEQECWKVIIFLLREHQCRRMLFGGNGISPLPRFFAHGGCDVTALDTSSVATQFARQQPLDEWAWERWASRPQRWPSMKERRAQAAAGALGRPLGQLEYVTADLFDWEPGEESFDAAILAQVAEHYGEADRTALAKRLYSWLRPGGILVLQSQLSFSLVWPLDLAKEGVEESFEAAGFLLHRGAAYRWCKHHLVPLDGATARERRRWNPRWWHRLTPGAVERRERRNSELAALEREFVRLREENEPSDWEQVHAGAKLQYCLRTR